MHTIFRFAVIYFCCGMALSCTKISDIRSDSDVCLTYYDTSVNFGEYRTFLLRDTVAYISDLKGEQTIQADSTLISSIIPAIASELLQRGYVQADSLGAADFAINIALANISAESIQDVAAWSKNQDLNSYLEWYSDGAPIWGNFSGFWYPWTYKEIRTADGVLLIEFVSAHSVQELRKDSSTPLEFLWQAIITGVIADGTYSPQKGADYIDEAFNQSAYLLRN